MRQNVFLIIVEDVTPNTIKMTLKYVFRQTVQIVLSLFAKHAQMDMSMIRKDVKHVNVFPPILHVQMDQNR